MLKKLVLSIMVLVFGMFMANAATRSNAPLEMAQIDDPASEMQCLEAFVDSRFTYAHRLCLSLAQRGMIEAQLVTGLMYALGEGTLKNPDLAKLWLNEAMRNGNDDAKEALIEFNLLD